MAPLILEVHDVGSGAYLYVQTPSGKKVVVDCGSCDYSPSEEINPTFKRKAVDYLIISHPHKDHISDILRLDDKFNVKLLHINRDITLEMVKRRNTDDDFDPDKDECLQAYYRYADRFDTDISWEESPRNPKWGCGCTFHCHNARGSDLKINDLSVTLFIRFGEHVIFYGADIEKKGWEYLLEKKIFKKYLKETTIFIAPHHGNESGYNPDAFDYCDPKVIVMSTGPNSDTVVSKYEQWPDGLEVNRPDGKTEHRKILTTRHDGRIKMVFYKGYNPKITVEK